MIPTLFKFLSEYWRMCKHYLTEYPQTDEQWDMLIHDTDALYEDFRDTDTNTDRFYKDLILAFLDYVNRIEKSNPRK